MASATGDRNLLFGILALQMDFIGRDALVRAMHAWVLDKAKPLGQILLEQGALTADTHALLDALVRKHLELHGGDAEKSLASVSSFGSAREELRQIADAAVQASLAHVPAARPPTADPYATDPPSAGAPSAVGRRFRILRPHAKGGLGEVFVARDEELHREVALKEIQVRHADHPESRARFLVEAEITGGLEHPGIVPVYGLGTYADGRPFYAMRFIKGDSLKEAIERFHKPEAKRRAAGEQALELRKLLGRFVDVCDAIGYAHSRGVLHRDLKPGNVMLGKYGETLVVDWGLAKPLGAKEQAQASEEPALQPSSASGSAETLPGKAIGTPAYMSPEQAAGRLEQMGPASDVYGLGATLYTLLTGKPPFSDPDIGAVLRQVERGEFPRLRQVNRSVPPAMEAICLKAMALKAGDRYASTRALAEDVEHWLADEPVSVYRERWTERVVRWARRRPGAAAFLALFVAALLVGTTISTFFAISSNANYVDARRHEKDANDKNQQLGKTNGELEEQKRQAERQLEFARASLMTAQLMRAEALWRRDPGLAWDVLRDETACPVGRRDFAWRLYARLCKRDRLTLPADAVSVAFSPDGRTILTGGFGVRRWDADAGQEQGTPWKHDRFFHAIAFSSDGTTVALGEDATVRLWDAITAEERTALKGDAGRVTALAFSPDGKSLASGDKEGAVKLWDTETGQEQTTLQDHDQSINAIAFSPDGKTLAACTGDGRQVGEARLWYLGTRRKPADLVQEWGGYFALAFSPDGKLLAAGGCQYGTLQLWDVASGEFRADLKKDHGSVSAVAFSPDGKTLASGDGAGAMELWDMGGSQEHVTLRGSRGEIHALAFSPDGKTLASANSDETVQLWDVTRGQERAVLRGHLIWDVNVLFTRDGQTLVSADASALRLWDVSSATERVKVDFQLLEYPKLVLSPDGRTLASSGLSGVQLWDAGTGERRAVVEEEFGGSPTVAFTPDGKTLAFLKDEVVHLWDIGTGRERVTLRGHDGSVTCLAFSPDGAALASGGEDGTVRLWDAGTGQERGVLRGHDRWVSCVAFSPDGNTLASGSWDGTVRLWDGRPLQAVADSSKNH